MNRVWGRSACLAGFPVVAALMIGIAPAKADLDTPIDFNMPAGDLASTLVAISRQGKVMIAFPSEIVAGRSAAALQGRLSAREALLRILTGTGLRLAPGAGGSVTVVRDGGGPGAAAVPGGDVAAIDVTDESAMSRFGDVGFQAGDAGDTVRLAGAPAKEIPLPINTVTSKVIQSQGITQATDAVRNVSGVVAGSSAGDVPTFTIRGFQTSVVSVNGQGINGFNNALSPQPPIDEVERVEVLKGATSILTGQSANGGVINVATKQPTSTEIRDMVVRYGSFNYKTIALDLGGPLAGTENLTYRFVMSGNQADENYAGYRDPHEYLISPAVRWDNGETLFQAGLRYYKQNRVPSQYTFVPEDFTGVPRPLRIPRGTTQVNPELHFLNETMDITSNQSHRFGDIFGADVTFNNRFLYRVGYGDVNNFTWNTLARGLNGRYLAQQNYSSSSYDLMTNESDLTLTYDAGFARQTSKFGIDFKDFSYNSTTRRGAPFRTDPLTAFPQQDLLRVPSGGFRNNEYSFVDARYVGYYYLEKFDTLDNRLHILGSVRYNRNRQQGQSSLIATRPDDAIPSLASGLSWETGAVFDVTPYFSIYGSRSSGFVPNYGTLATTGQPPPPETRDSTDVGANMFLFDRKLTLKAAYFDLNQTNVTICPPSSTDCTRDIILLPGKRSTGFELDMQGEIAPGLNVIGSFSSTVAKFQSANYKPAATGIPQYTASLWATYTVQTGEFQGLTLGIGARGVSNSVTSVSGGGIDGNARLYTIPGYVTAEALVAYDIDRWSLQFKINNIFDKYYYDPSYFSTLIGIGQGRNFLLTARYAFE